MSDPKEEPKDKNLIERGLDAVKGIFKGPDPAKAPVPGAAPSSAAATPGGAAPARSPERSDRKFDEMAESLQEINDALSTLARSQGEAYRDAVRGFEERSQKTLGGIVSSQQDLLHEIRRSQEQQTERLDQALASIRANLRVMLFLSFFFLAALAFLLIVVLRLSKSGGA